MRIYLVGFMGCGKTTVGKRLANKLGLKFLDLDHYIEEKHSKSIPMLFEEAGENGFRELERAAIREVSTLYDDVLVSTGGGAPCFFDNMEVMKASGITIYLKMNPEALASRLYNGRKSRPLLRDKSEEELVDYIRETLLKRDAYYENSRIIVSALSIDVDGLVNRIYHFIKA